MNNFFPSPDSAEKSFSPKAIEREERLPAGPSIEKIQLILFILSKM